MSEELVTSVPAVQSDPALCQSILNLGGGSGLLEGLEQCSFSNLVKLFKWKLPVLPLLQAWWPGHIIVALELILVALVKPSVLNSTPGLTGSQHLKTIN